MSKHTPIQITERAVIAGALLAMKEDRLMAQVAQSRAPLMRKGCTYDNAVYGCRCLIGAGLTDNDIASLKDWRKNSKTLSGLVAEGYAIVVSDDGTEDLNGFHRLLALQQFHDSCTDPGISVEGRTANLIELQKRLNARAAALGLAA